MNVFIVTKITEKTELDQERSKTLGVFFNLENSEKLTNRHIASSGKNFFRKEITHSERKLDESYDKYNLIELKTIWYTSIKEYGSLIFKIEEFQIE